ncbi:MAG: 3-deoxy-7-phosphoheptulonate synthase [Gammaproteobacteria bacterium]
MLEKYNDIRIQSQKPLISPSMLFKEFPVDSNLTNKIAQFRHTARRIIQGQDDRLLVIVGPCSIHDVKAALEFAEKLTRAATQYEDDLFLIMRVYFEKPRTTIGWKGLINDPRLDNSFDVNYGLALARKLLIDLNELNVPAGTEFLDTIIPQYLSELISWSAIGARTSESQLHRELASGLSTPVGFKNSTDGNIQIAIDAVNAARHPHHFLSIANDGSPVILNTTGNNFCHIILRGSNDQTNYSINQINAAAKLLKNIEQRPHLMVDCSHGNSMRHHQNQLIAARSVAEQIKQGSTVISGVMLESNLIAGNQRLEPNSTLNYGQSITDECIAWDETVPLLHELACAVRERRRLKSCKSVKKLCHV